MRKQVKSKCKQTPEVLSQNERPQVQKNLTPRKRVAAKIAEAGLTPQKFRKSFNKHVMADKINETRNENGQNGRRIISGKLIRKFNMKRRWNRMIGIKRRTEVSKTCNQKISKEKRRTSERGPLFLFLEKISAGFNLGKMIRSKTMHNTNRNVY